MNLTQQHKQFIRNAFMKMNSKEDLLELLNFTKELVYGKKAFPFEIRNINFYCSPKANPKRYTSFSVKKKSGTERTIHAPVAGLKALQRCLNLILQVVYEKHQHKAAKGFIANKSIVDNALLHVGKNYVYNVDLKDFFPSIDQARVWGRLQHPPFNLKDNRIEIANILASLCCNLMEVERLDHNALWVVETRNVLPQGAPTSPTISNIICQQLDFYLSAVAKRFNLVYSRYADDLTFSSSHNVYQKNSDFIKELHRIVASQNFQIKASKTRLQKEGYRQEVTGLVVNEKVNVSQRYIKQLRQWLFYWEKFGYENAENRFKLLYIKDKGHTKKDSPNMKSVIQGKLNFLKMIKGAEDTAYLQLFSKFNSLTSTTVVNKVKKVNSITLLSHNPEYGTDLLLYFKKDSFYKLKQLVHPSDIDETPFAVLDKIKSHPNLIKEFKGIRSENFKPITKGLQLSMVQLIREFESALLRTNGAHPFDTDETYIKLAKEFKRNYRFGPKNSEYTNLESIILNSCRSLSFSDDQQGIVYAFNETDTSGCFNISQLTFFPDERKFNLLANFYTWVPSIILGLKEIFRGILQYSNLNGIKPFIASEKRIIIDINKYQDPVKGSLLELSILDEYSLPTRDAQGLLDKLRSSSCYTNYFRSVCNWYVEYHEDGQLYHLVVLSDDSKSDKDIIVSPSTGSAGFKHILQFYNF